MCLITALLQQLSGSLCNLYAIAQLLKGLSYQNQLKLNLSIHLVDDGLDMPKAFMIQ